MLLAALRPSALRVWAAVLVLLPLVPSGSASATAGACVVHGPGEVAADVRGPAGGVVADVLRRCEAAVPVVSSFWPRWERRVTVVVTRDVAELEALLPGSGDLTDVAALATDRVYVNPEAYATLSPAGRQVVLTHEVTHVATHAVKGVPTWLVEGFAETVAHAAGAIPVEVAAQELGALVQEEGVPEGPLDDAAFGSGDVAAHYAQAWRAVDLVARTHGRTALERWYRAAGDPAALGVTEASLRAAWRADLARTFR